MSQHVKLKKGLNIKLSGAAPLSTRELNPPDVIAIQPDDFKYLNPKLLVKEGDEIEVSTPLFYDRNNEKIKICSPVSGEVVEILRGEKRKILAIKILTDKTPKYKSFQTTQPTDLTREELIKTLLDSGVWPYIRQRPFDTIADPDDSPKSIFISAFDTNPLAPDYSYILKGEEKNFQAGLDALSQMTDGSVHLNINISQANEGSFKAFKNVTINEISGPHPAGNVGIQVHHLDPLNKGEVIWYVNPQDMLVIGKLFTQGIYDASKLVVVAGSQLTQPMYFKTLPGIVINEMLKQCGVKDGLSRVISGSVLSGRQRSTDAFTGFYDAQVTVIPEGNEPEFMGWLAPGLNKFSMSRTYFSWLKPGKLHDLNTNMHGEERPFVMTGEYEKVLPMNIFPVQLLKSILIEDIEMMEKLGIYEVAEEDFALCEVICTSKIKAQEIVGRGLEIIKKEFS